MPKISAVLNRAKGPQLASYGGTSCTSGHVGAGPGGVSSNDLSALLLALTQRVVALTQPASRGSFTGGVWRTNSGKGYDRSPARHPAAVSIASSA